MATPNYISHIFSTAVLFTLGNIIISTSTFSPINTISSLVVVLLTCFLLKFGQKNQTVRKGMALIMFALGVYGAATTFFDYIQFLKAEQMQKTSIVLLAIVFALVVAIFCAKKTRAIYKYCLLSFVVISVIMALCFIGGIKNFDYKNLELSLFDFNFSPKTLLPLAVLSFFYEDAHPNAKATVCGVLIGCALLLVAVLQTNLTFGANSQIVYPYFKAVGVISSGSLFTRLDGLIWFLFFSTSLIKTTICIKTIFKSVKWHHLKENFRE